MLQSMGSQRVGQDLETEQHHQEKKEILSHEWNPAISLLIPSPEANSPILSQRGEGTARGKSLIFECYAYLELILITELGHFLHARN